eukprot:CAMPEP_0174279022 /NCGR_PEP_ID=MMETSP0439-20130205/61803_1 /TAXON_ID=0 /ORGANISM="Stereomyxa ramosa, Strain Chinc5" /LENGTH=173 /DNA_ID=CAMNT_0015371497 /DNA_START=508 /DNA_END=1029 /DNA_ORIENTATION=+
MEVLFAPSGGSGEVVSIGIGELTSIESLDSPLPQAVAGDYVSFSVACADVKKGMICGEVNNDPPRQVLWFVASVVVFNSDRIEPGYCAVFDFHITHVRCTFEELLQAQNRRTSVIEEAPEYVKNGDCAVVKIVPSKPLCVESFEKFSSLGRFIVRDARSVVCVGVVKELGFAE